MSEIEKHADRLYQKFISENLIADDFEFFKEIREVLPYTNVYFLCCLTEIICDFVNEQKFLNKHLKNFSFQDLLRLCVKKAEKLYLSTDISGYLMENF